MKREPGFFLALVIEHNFPPGFTPQEIVKPRVDMHEVSTRSRETALSRGYTGTIKGLSARSGLIVGDASKAAVSQPMLSREQAAELRLTRYFDGDRCSAGHRAERYVSTRACCACVRERDIARGASKRVASVSGWRK